MAVQILDHSIPGQNLHCRPDVRLVGGNDAMVLRTPKALPKHRCAGNYALGTCADRLGHRQETEDRAQERVRHMLG